MLKTAIAATGLLALSGVANAYQIKDVITGADMAGMTVTAYFSDNTSQTSTWKVISKDGTVAFGEGYKGGALGTGWSLTQQGYTLGNITDDKKVLGAWTLTNNRAYDLTKISIYGKTGNIAFDNILDPKHTAGSDMGRPFTAEANPYNASYAYSMALSAPDLWSRLDINLSSFSANSTLRFVADTDAVGVSEPATLALLGLGVIGLVGGRRLSSKK